MSFEKEVEVAREAARRAGELALRYRRGNLDFEAKPDNSPVTIADRDAERLIASALAGAFPGDGVLGEEGARGEASSGRRWIVDPIDGTRDYVRGSPSWAVLIGLEVNNEVVAGVCEMPALGMTFTASSGDGAWMNGSRLRVSSVASPSEAVLCVNSLTSYHLSEYRDSLLEWISRFWTVRSMGGCLDAMLVAQGQADAWIDPSAAPWDLAALKIIIEEAGGRLLDFHGTPTIYGGNAVACVPALEADLLAYVSAHVVAGKQSAAKQHPI
jgi:histidinol phosphatase-like enzyme (inositol monophosphatase family)